MSYVGEFLSRDLSGIEFPLYLTFEMTYLLFVPSKTNDKGSEVRRIYEILMSFKISCLTSNV